MKVLTENNMEMLDGRSMDIIANNIEKLRAIFPEVFCEDKVDFEKLQEVLGNYIEDKEERYRFEWNGKSQAIRIAQTPSTGTLRPCKEESKNWDTTQNLYIEGDNLEVLKLLQKSYQNKIKMIYIDPPYNTGNDFVYKDDFRDNIKNYLTVTGQLDAEGNEISTNSESSGRYHTDWLNMMYPRLRLSKNLLKDSGVIFISIDDVEVNNLRKVCDEIFGEDNFIGCFIWRGGRRNASKVISTSHEYILAYSKNIDFCLKNNILWREKKKGLNEIYNISQKFVTESKGNYLEASKKLKDWYKKLSDDDESKLNEHYCWIDKNGVYFASDISRGGGGGPKWEIRNPITNEVVKTPSRGWAYSKIEDLEEDIENGYVHFNGNGVPCKKRYLKENELQLIETVFYKDRRGSSKRLKNLMNGNVFNFPKDENILAEKINSFTENDDIILDFFSGSATIAHAVFNANINDNSNRKFIMIQLPEKLEEKSEAYKMGYKNICEIGKERIRRAGEKVISENKDKKGVEDLDIGFKVLKLDSSNIKKWNPDYDNLELSFEDMLDNFISNRTEEDVVYEIMLKYGIDLTYPVEEKIINGKKIYSVGFGALIICLDNDITLDVIEGIVEVKKELSPEVCRVVFKDNGFANDSVKTNAIQILRRNNIKEVMSI